MQIGVWRRALAGVALMCHLFTALGFPVPAATHKNGAPFPCQDHPCGCPTAEQCWAGDCCCFTLEEKLAWAEARGVEPPAHVRPMVEVRKPTPTPKRKKSCCDQDGPHDAPTPAKIAATPSCCASALRPAKPSCCSAEIKHRANLDCPTYVPATSAKTCCDAAVEPSHEDTPPTDNRAGVRWVGGVIAQKCRGQGPGGLLQLEPAIVPNVTPVPVAVSDRSDHPAPRSDRAVSVSHLPPTPPPRQS